MFGISYLRADPTTYVVHYSKGRVKREGQGLAFFFFAPQSTIVAVPTGTMDVPFIFNEMTADYQQVSLQGQITYRISDPKKMAQQLNFTIEPRSQRHVSDDPEKLGQRVVNLAQVLTRPEIQRLALKDVLVASREVMTAAMAASKGSEVFQTLGVEVLAFTVLAIKPTPEIAKAIEAEAREALQRKSDEAIAERRNAAVEQERRIRENELKTELTVQQKRQELAASQLAAEIALEKERAKYIDTRAENARKEADAQAYALAATLRPLAALDPQALQVLAAGRTDPRTVIALALKDLAQDAAKIGQLNITPDLLASLLHQPPCAAGEGEDHAGKARRG